MQLSGSLDLAQFTQVRGEPTGRALDVDVVAAEHPAPASQSVDAELTGLLEGAHAIQAGREVMRCVQRLGIVVTQHSLTPSESVLAELVSLAVGADIDEDADVGISAAQGVPVV